MELLDRIEGDLKSALKSGDKIRLQVLRALRAVVKNAEIAKQAALQEADVFTVIKTELKKRKESVEAFVKAKRSELAEQEEKEAIVLQEYLPKQLSNEEIDVHVQQIAQELSVTSQKEFGKLMGAVMKKVGATADGTQVKQRVQHYLSAQEKK